MKRKLIIPALTIGTLLIGSLAFAHGQKGTRDRDGYCDGPNRGMGYGMSAEDHEQHMAQRMAQRMNFMAVALDLTDAQQAQLKDLEEKHRQEHQEMRDRMQTNRQEMRGIAQSEDFDKEAFHTKAAQQADLKTEMMAGRTSMKQQMLAILTPEQQVKAEKLWALNDDDGHMGMMGYGRGMMGSGMGMMGSGMGMGYHGDRDDFRGEGHHGRNSDYCRAEMRDDS